MSKRFKVEHNDWFDNPTMYITLHKGPYTKERILYKTGWLTKDCKITEMKEYRTMHQEEE